MFYRPSTITAADFEHIKYLGSGTFGVVSLVQKIGGVDAGRTYALKAIKKEAVVRRKNGFKHLQNELRALKEVDGNMGVRLFYTFQTDYLFYLAMEHVDGCDLWTYIHKVCRRLTLKATQFFTAQIMLAIDYLHEEQIVFRDLKPENIMVGLDGYLKLIDFGHAKMEIKTWCTKMYSVIGTIYYTAPEQLDKSQGYTKMVDWWAVGVVAYQMFFGRLPFDSENRKEVCRKILEDEPYLPMQTNKQFKEFIQVLLRKDPNQRVGSTGKRSLMLYDFMKDVDVDAFMAKTIDPPLAKKVPSNPPDDTEAWKYDENVKHDHFYGFDYTAPQLRSLKRPAPPDSEEVPVKRTR